MSQEIERQNDQSIALKKIYRFIYLKSNRRETAREKSGIQESRETKWRRNICKLSAKR
jgi:hypothetical protein